MTAQLNELTDTFTITRADDGMGNVYTYNLPMSLNYMAHGIQSAPEPFASIIDELMIALDQPETDEAMLARERIEEIVCDIATANLTAQAIANGIGAALGAALAPLVKGGNQ